MNHFVFSIIAVLSLASACFGQKQLQPLQAPAAQQQFQAPAPVPQLEYTPKAVFSAPLPAAPLRLSAPVYTASVPVTSFRQVSVPVTSYVPVTTIQTQTVAETSFQDVQVGAVGTSCMVAGRCHSRGRLFPLRSVQKTVIVNRG